jgi:hypothetical protein
MASRNRIIAPRFSAEQARKLIMESIDQESDYDDDTSSDFSEQETDSVILDQGTSECDDIGCIWSTAELSEAQESSTVDTEVQQSVENDTVMSLLENVDNELDLIASYMYVSKNGRELWMKTPYAATGRLANHNVLKVKPGPTAYARRNADTPVKALQLFFTREIQNMIIQRSNEEGARVFGEEWSDIATAEFGAYIGLISLFILYWGPFGRQATWVLARVATPSYG